MAAAGSSGTYGLSLVELLDDGWHTRSVWETPETLPCLPKTVSPAAQSIHHRLSLDEYADYANTTLFPLPKHQEEGYLPAHPTFSRQHSDGLIITSHMDTLSMSIMTQSPAADQPLPMLFTAQLIATSASSDRVLRQPSNCIQYAATRSSSSSTTTAIPPTTNDNHPEINPTMTENTAASAPVTSAATSADGVAYRSSAMQAAVRPRTSLHGGKGKPGSMMFGMSMSAMDVFHMEVEVNQRGEDTAHGGWRQRQESLTGMGMEESALEDGSEHGSRHGAGRQRELPVSQLMAMLKQQAGGNKHPQPPAQLVAAPMQQRSFNPPVQPPQPAQQQQGWGHASLHKANPKDVSREAPAGAGAVQQACDQIASDAAAQPTHRRPEHEWDDSAHRAHQNAKGGAKQAAADVLAATLLPPGQEEGTAQPVTAQGRLLHATRTWVDAASTAATSPSEVPAELVTMASLPRSATLSPCTAYEGIAGVSVASNREIDFVQGGSRATAEFSFGVGAASSRPINTGMKPGSITVVKRQMGSSGRYEVVPYPLYEPVHSNVPAHGQPIRVVGFNIRE